MANEILVKPGTPITWKDSGGTNVITLQNLAFASGRVGAEYDKGAGAQEAWFHVHFVVQWENDPVAGEAAELYLLSHDGTNIPAGVGTADAAVTVANKRNNMHCPLVVVSASAPTGSVNYEATGLAYLPMRYISPVVWNASAAKNLKNSANVCVITLTSLVDELQ